ncbi:amidohydrolase family protein [Nocardioides marmotae]|uniref:amidohydrolase family protein n=1 Tax=Nocardioides marmotae TaxID=2663857 RepID=UPI001495C706|nr:amidohydrolase family protein [Nocardioides marmotae]QKE03033.1 amidohydrolase family protein [Nocardioides marmotae]
MLGGAAASGALGAAASPAASKPGASRHREFVVTGAHVVSMDPRVGDLPDGDIHVRNGRIVKVGHRLRVRAPQMDGRGMIAMPGLVDTHWHLWTTLFRAMSSSSPETAYFALNIANGVRALPEDLYHGARLALVEALNTGITTVHDWSHNLRSPAHADANLRAHREIGLRGRFSYGTPQGHPATSLVDLDDIARVKREWFDGGKVPLLHLGLAGRPPGLVGEAVFRPEYDAARGLGIPVSYHANSTRAHGQIGMIRQLAEQDMLTPDTQLIHALYTTEAERAAVRESGASVSISPWSELLIGYGVTPVGEMEASGMLMSLSVDTLSLVGSGDLWSVLRLATGLYRGLAEQELAVGTRRILQMATIDAATSLGLGDVVGSLTPGKRADLVLVRKHDVGTAPVTDVSNTLALATGAENVDTVIVDGRLRKRRGVLVDIDEDRVVRGAERALAALLAR